MSLIRRLVSGTYRRGRIAEARGHYRDAAALYAASGAESEAARALAQAAERCDRIDEALSTYRDALRWAPANDPIRRELLALFGGRVLRRARGEGLTTSDDRQILVEAAEALTEAERFVSAADAWELLGDWERSAKCLERAGEIERLEALLSMQTAERESVRAVGKAIAVHEAALAVGARQEALAALDEASAFAPEDATLLRLRREIESRRSPPCSVRLRIDGDSYVLVGQPRLILGRDPPIGLRGPSVSRRHTELRREGDVVWVADLGSRNGTRVRGIPIDQSLAVEPPIDVALGDDLEARVELLASSGVSVRITRGFDQGLRILGSEHGVEIARANFGFADGWAFLEASRERPVLLAGQRCVAPIQLLIGDRVIADGVAIEVLG